MQEKVPKIMFDKSKQNLSIDVETQLVPQWLGFFSQEEKICKIVSTFLPQNLKQSVDLILSFFK